MSASSTRPTVAVVAPRYLDVGGMQNYVRRVVQWLRERGDVDVLVVTSTPGLRRRETWEDGVRVIGLGTWLTLSNTPVNPFWWWQLRSIYRRYGVDVVDAHSPVPFLADLAVAAAGPRPAILTYHAGSMVKGTGGLVDVVLRAYERHVLPRVFARAARLISVSPVATTIHTGRSTTITPGVDTTVFAPAAGAVREPSVVYVGRVERTSAWKGLHGLVDALPQVLRGVPGARLEIVGGGDAVPELVARAAALGVGEHIVWHGPQDQAGVRTVLQRAGVTVLPSLTEAESFGMSLIEAMACGSPVIGSDIGGIPHVVRDGVDGLIVPPGDVTALATAITTVLGDPELAARLGTEGRRAAERTWDWSHQEERTMDELHAALPRIPAGVR